MKVLWVWAREDSKSVKSGLDSAQWIKLMIDAVAVCARAHKTANSKVSSTYVPDGLSDSCR